MDGLLSLNQLREINPLVEDLNQYNPSSASTDGFLPKDREGAAFPSSCRVQPCATQSAWHGKKSVF